MNVFREGLYRGKSVFITGGSSGIGLRVAESFGELGAKVSICARKPEKIDAAVARLKGKGIDARGFVADVRDYAAVEKALDGAVAVQGLIDVLICGAAGNFPAPALGMSSNGFKAVMEIDVLGTFHACRAAFERLNKPGACILNISAPQASIPYPMQAHVCAAKAGVDMLTRTLAMEWGPAGVRLNSISPGPIAETEGMDRLAPDATTREKLSKLLPLQRFGTKDDVARMCLFLASDAGAYCTGGVHSVDGGMALIGGYLMAAVTG